MKIVKKMSDLFVSTLKKIQKCNPVIQVVFYAVIFLAAKHVIETFLAMGGNIFSEGFTGQGKEMVLFHMNGCGHCKKMMPEWDKFQQNAPQGVKVSKVEQAEKPDLLEKLGIQGFPSIKLFNNGKPVKDYNGERTAEAFASFVKSA